MKIEIESILLAFDEALELVEDEQQRERFSRVLGASRASVERAVDDLIAEVTAEVNEALGDELRVDLNYGSEGMSVDVTRPPAEPVDEDEARLLSEGEVEKLTLRLPQELKDRSTAAAAQAGSSLNSWIVRVLARELAGARDDDDPWEYRSRRRRRRRSRAERGAQLRGWIGG